MTAHRLAVFASLLLALPSVALAQDRKYAVKKETSSVSYKLIHKLHEVVGTAKPSAGVAILKADGTLQVQVRANVKDFDSGNGNRDAHMLEVTEAAKYPLVDFKGKATNVKLPTTFPAEVPVTVAGELTFHGEKQNIEVPMKVKFTSAKDATA